MKNTKKANRFVGSRTMNSLIGMLLSLSAYGQPANEKLLTFQKFVNGEIPIKEAIVLRTISKTNGVVINQEWWRFGYQDDTWYVQRLRPDGQDSFKYVPAPSNEGAIIGASSTHYWTLSDTIIHLSARTNAIGTVPDNFGEFPRNLMFSAISLGLPRRLDTLELSEIGWKGLTYNTIVESEHDKNRALLKTAELEGKLVLNKDGIPASTEFQGVGERPNGLVAYEYSNTNLVIPNIFIVREPHLVARFEFLSLKLGKNDLTKTDGYTPSLFGDMKIARVVTVWSNSLPYEFKDGKLKGEFETEHPKRIGFTVIVSLIVISGTILALFYWRSKAKE